MLLRCEYPAVNDFISSGTSYACIPLRIQPPVADVGQAVDPKKGGKPAAGGKTAAAAATPLASMPLIKRGALKLRLDISATTAWRNWLRKGKNHMALLS